MRLAFFVCLFVCCGLIAAIMASPMGNKYAVTVELCKFFTLGGNQTCIAYDFTPLDFSFSSTSIVYKLEFSPRRAVPHEVVVFYPTPIGYRDVINALTNFSARLTIKHGSEKLSVVSDANAKYPCHFRKVIGENSSGFVHELFRFKPGDFSWRYDDAVELFVEVCSSAEDVELFKNARMKLRLQEGWIIR